MFTCSTCLRRTLRSLLNDLPQNEPLLLSRPIPQTRSISHARSFSSTPTSRVTLRSLSRGHHRRTYLEARRDLAKDRQHAPPGAAQSAAVPSSTRRNKARERPVDRRNRHAVENNQKHLLLGSDQKELQIAAAKEAEWINDPLRLANRTLTYLRDNEPDSNGFDKALELVRASEIRSIKQGKPQGVLNNVVSWNHLMDFCMSKSDPRSAYKVYNEMKKRGHKPDAHTYTIMLRGFGDNISKPNAVKDAMRVYENLLAPNSEMNPNTVHLNAALNVCARQVDMDSMWNLVGRAKDRGPGSPDVTTYTILLNAMQKDIIKRMAQIVASDKDADTKGVLNSAVRDGRKVWVDVVMKWRNAEINVDEHLVCAMGRLLLMSKQKSDVMDVFTLVQQTMNIRMPRAPVERLSEERLANQERSPKDEEAMKVFEQADRGKQATIKPFEGPAKSLYATPGNNTLSMLLEAATITKQMHIGKAYWDLLTDAEGHYAVRPDVQNIGAFLRILRISRSSRVALEMLRRDWPEEIKKKLYTRGNFVIAMSTCVRDKNNPNVFEMASRIVDIMQDKANKDHEAALEKEEEAAKQLTTIPYKRGRKEDEDFQGESLELDPKVLTMYLNLAMWTTKGVNPQLRLKTMQNGDLDFERNPSKNNTFRALKRLGPTIVNVRRMMKSRLAELEKQELSPRERIQMNKKSKDWIDYSKTQERLEDMVGLFRGLISAYDRLLSVNYKLEDEGMGPLDGEWLEEVKTNKAKLNVYMSKIDRKILVKMQLGRSGLWEGYDPVMQPDADRLKPAVQTRTAPIAVSNEPDTSYGAVDKHGRLISEPGSEAEDNTVPQDMSLHRTPGVARMRKEVNKQVKVIETQRENTKKWLSRRQTQEKEKARREDRQSNLYPEEAMKRRYTPTRSSKDFARTEESGQRGWGGGYEAMAQRMGQGGKAGLVDVQQL